jgi:hypothetical protein
MKKLLSTAILLFGLSLHAQAESVINVPAINQYFRSLTAAYQQKHPEITKLSFTFDPARTSFLDSYYLGMKLDLEMENSAWSPKPSTLTGEFEMATHREIGPETNGPIVKLRPKLKDAQFRTQVVLKTDTVAFGNHMVEIAKKGICSVEYSDITLQEDGAFYAVLCPRLKTQPELLNLEDLIDFVQELGAMQVLAYGNLMRNLRFKLADAANEKELLKIETQIATYRLKRDIILGSSKYTPRQPDGSRAHMRIAMPKDAAITLHEDKKYTPDLVIEFYEFAISKTQIQVGCLLSRSDFMGMFGAKMKFLVGPALEKISNGDEDSRLFLLSFVSSYIQSFEHWVFKQ